jgi:hypothetical protein
MKIRLFKRNYGYHSFVKEVEISGTFRKYSKKLTVDPNGIGDDYLIKEERLLDEIPEGFLPQQPKNILLVVQDLSRRGSTGIRDLKVFRPWSKYFSSYCIELCRD